MNEKHMENSPEKENWEGSIIPALHPVFSISSPISLTPLFGKG